MQFVCFPLGRRFGEKVQSVRDEVPREYQGRVREVKHFVLVLVLIFSVSSRCIDFVSGSVSQPMRSVMEPFRGISEHVLFPHTKMYLKF